MEDVLPNIGTLQGLIELSGIPLIGCGVSSSALCMDKERAHKLVKEAGIRVPFSVVISAGYNKSTVTDFADKIGLPLFVKPLKAGSSYGITKVTNIDELFSAIELAFSYDSEVIIEENIDGFEVGTAIMGIDNLVIGEVDEI